MWPTLCCGRGQHYIEGVAYAMLWVWPTLCCGHGLWNVVGVAHFMKGLIPHTRGGVHMARSDKYFFLLQYKDPPHEYSTPDEIQGNQVRTVSVHTHTSSLKSSLSQAHPYSSPPSSFQAWPCVQTTSGLVLNHSILIPKPL